MLSSLFGPRAPVSVTLPTPDGALEVSREEVEFYEYVHRLWGLGGSRALKNLRFLIPVVCPVSVCLLLACFALGFGSYLCDFHSKAYALPLYGCLCS